MVKIVTGKINSFKTTKLLEHYELNHLGDGFIARKNMDGDIVQSYDLVRLSDKNTIPYIIRDNYDNGEYEIAFQLGPYRFIKSALTFIETNVDNFIVKKVNPVYLDEISLLELDNLGYHQALIKLLNKNIDLVLVIREDLLEQVLEKYHIVDYVLI